MNTLVLTLKEINCASIFYKFLLSFIGLYAWQKKKEILHKSLLCLLTNSSQEL